MRINPTIIKPYFIKSNIYNNVLRINLMNKYKERQKAKVLMKMWQVAVNVFSSSDPRTVVAKNESI